MSSLLGPPRECPRGVDRARRPFLPANLDRPDAARANELYASSDVVSPCLQIPLLRRSGVWAAEPCASVDGGPSQHEKSDDVGEIENELLGQSGKFVTAIPGPRA